MIRPATPADWNQITALYAAARDFMCATGNPRQWGTTHPPLSQLEEDIPAGHLFVCEEEGQLLGVFAFILGIDPTYIEIEGGSWLNDQPYGTIHRICGDNVTKGVFGKCLDYCLTKTDNVRIDTHEDNKIMQHVLEKHGFQRCGIIYVFDGTPRLAYHLAKSTQK